MNIICVIYFLIQYVQNTIISMCNQNKITNEIFVCWVLEVQCEFYTYSTSQPRLATAQVLSGHMWLVVAALDNPVQAFSSSEFMDGLVVFR